MRKSAVSLLIFVLVVSFSNGIDVSAKNQTKAAFIRDGNLWLLLNNQETQITKSRNVHGIQWSHDGKWILYQMQAPSQFEPNKIQNEIWVYHLETSEKKRIFYDGYEPQWAPNKAVVAFQDNGVLNISNLKEFRNVALGVYGFTWLPDGSGFLMSSRANLNPDGWTNPVLYEKKLPKNWDEINLFANVKEFFVVPKDLRVDNKNVMSINVDSFLFSPSKKWISFIVSPTASLAMDSNMLCAISSDGERFETLDEMILGVGEPKWAPSKDILAYIAGGGRIVFGFRGKDLKYKEFPVASLTPSNYAELNFTWVSNSSIVTSRVEAKDWSNEFSEHPLPSLYSVHLNKDHQTKIIEAQSGYGDYDPQFIRSMNKLIWFRGTSITDSNRNVWFSDADGSNAKLWLKNVDAIEFYEEK